ncbi:MAG: hypothetical protein OXM59_13080 [Gammaproteobacteria bacterium]|nr:hypothetical protein [Gammaproteobacteria bacterium]
MSATLRVVGVTDLVRETSGFLDTAGLVRSAGLVRTTGFVSVTLEACRRASRERLKRRASRV